MNQDVNDGEGLRGWDMYGEPSLNRFLKCFFTLAEYVIGISVEHLSHSDIGKCNLAYTWTGKLSRPTANLRYRHHPLEARTGYPPAADTLCSADHSKTDSRTSLFLLWTFVWSWWATTGLTLRWTSNPLICHPWGIGNDMLPALGRNCGLYNTGDTANVHSDNCSGMSHLAKSYDYYRER